MKILVGAAIALAVAVPAIALRAQTQPPAPAAAPANPFPVALMGPKIRVANAARSIKFYTEGLGLTARSMGTGAVISSSGKAPPPLILLVQDTKKPIVVGDGLFAMMMSVDDSDAFRAHLVAAGYAPYDEGTPGSFLIKDPDGYTIEVTPSQARPRAPRPQQ